jgi:hypothetical protein
VKFLVYFEFFNAFTKFFFFCVHHVAFAVALGLALPFAPALDSAPNSALSVSVSFESLKY